MMNTNTRKVPRDIEDWIIDVIRIYSSRYITQITARLVDSREKVTINDSPPWVTYQKVMEFYSNCKGTSLSIEFLNSNGKKTVVSHWK